MMDITVNPLTEAAAGYSYRSFGTASCNRTAVLPIFEIQLSVIAACGCSFFDEFLTNTCRRWTHSVSLLFVCSY